MRTLVLISCVLCLCALAHAVSESSPSSFAETKALVFDHNKMAAARSRRQHSPSDVFKKLQNKSNKITKGDSNCVMCQFVVQRIRAEMLMHGINGGVPTSDASSQLVGVPVLEGSILPAAGKPASAPTPALGGVPAAGPAGPAGAGAPPAGGPPPPGDDAAAAAAAAAGGPPPPGDAAAFLQMNAVSKHRKGAPAAAAAPAAGSAAGGDKTDVYEQRDRNTDMLQYRPLQARYAHIYDGPLRAAQRAQERFENNQIFAQVYQTIEGVCSRRMPKLFMDSCATLMAEYQKVAEGLRYQDRPDAICMKINLCDEYSYVRRAPHNVEREW